MRDIPEDFQLGAVEAGFRYANRPDLVLIYSLRPARAAGIFTTNVFKAAPVQVARKNLGSSSRFRAVLINAGQANACTGDEGLEDCRGTLQMAAGLLNVSAGEILPASTGVIGSRMPMHVWSEKLPLLKQALGQTGSIEAARGIMTTDKFPKTSSRELELERGKIRFLGMAKGAGMICPNMATMLAFIISDVEISGDLWSELLVKAVGDSFNAITVDGDTSTNDCVLALANGASEAGPGSREEEEKVGRALEDICRDLAYQIVCDAEGGTKVMHIRVTGAKNRVEAEVAARAVGNSCLVKTAMFGGDPNWGRIVAALGRSSADFDPLGVRLSLAGHEIFSGGRPAEMDIDRVVAPGMKSKDIRVEIDLGAGQGTYTLLASDLSEEYIRINADYRS